MLIAVLFDKQKWSPKSARGWLGRRKLKPIRRMEVTQTHLKYVIANAGKRVAITGGNILIERQDLTIIHAYGWHYDNRGYVAAKLKKKNVLLHRFLMGLAKEDERVVDHKNGVTSDNRRSNLRACTKSQNQMNRRKQANCSSQFKGVYKKANKWQAQIRKDGIRTTIGTFETEEAAARAYDARARELFGEFAKLNFAE